MGKGKSRMGVESNFDRKWVGLDLEGWLRKGQGWRGLDMFGKVWRIWWVG